MGEDSIENIEERFYFFAMYTFFFWFIILPWNYLSTVNAELVHLLKKKKNYWNLNASTARGDALFVDSQSQFSFAFFSACGQKQLRLRFFRGKDKRAFNVFLHSVLARAIVIFWPQRHCVPCPIHLNFLPLTKKITNPWFCV